MASRPGRSGVEALSSDPAADRRPGLDGLRGLAILLVVLFHSSLSFKPEGLAAEALTFFLRLG
jgi:peptidoglycan/LPS O-acetylase OafA/YrhL